MGNTVPLRVYPRGTVCISSGGALPQIRRPHEKSPYAKDQMMVRNDALENLGNERDVKKSGEEARHPAATTEQFDIGDGLVRLAIHSNITLTEVANIKKNLLSKARRAKELQLDLSDVPKIDVAGLTSILLAKRESQRAGNNLHVVAHHHAAIEVLEYYMASFFGDSVKANAQCGTMTRFKQAVLYHLRCSANETKGVGMTTALVTRNIQYAKQTTIGSRNWCCGTRQEPISIKKMLGAMDYYGPCLSQGRTNGISAPMMLVPGGPWHKRHPFCTTEKVGIA
ncbi:MAG: anti-sigma factor antagonist [Rhodocyclaceae bacterium]|nr:anti-sigma factor antagonist [Rhodocyclaceae bacterium]